jgi:diguanylate cyclase (GGDEF)-like protein
MEFSLSIQTLLTVNSANLLVTAAVLPLIMGRELSPAARHARNALMVMAAAISCLAVASVAPTDWRFQLIAAISIAVMAASHWMSLQGLQGWLGPRKGQWVMWVVGIVGPPVYWLLYDHFHWRSAWANALLAIELALVAYACLHPQRQSPGRWRWVIFGSAAVISAFSAARVVTVLVFPQYYTGFLHANLLNVSALLASNVAVMLTTVAVLVAWREEAEMELERRALTDGLTGLANRHAWSLQSNPLFDAARRHGHKMTLLVLDLDHFKRVNDTRGHAAGDQVLHMFGGVLQAQRRSSDVVARMGGEEFMVLLPQAGVTETMLLEERLRARWEQVCREELGHFVNYSAGIAHRIERDTQLADIMARADAALYRAKELGRGRTELALESMPTAFAGLEQG